MSGSRAVNFGNLAEAPTVEGDGVQLTSEQQAYLDWVERGKGSAVLEAVAGSGKTFILSRSCGLMKGRVAATAFNAKIAEEFGLKVKGLPNVLAKTFHSFGFAAWRKELGDTRVEVEARAKNKLMLQAAESKVGWAPLSALVSLAKQAGVIAAWDVDDVDEWNRLIDHFDVMLKVKEEKLVYGRPVPSAKQKMTPDEQRQCLIEEAQWCVLWALDKAKGADGGGAMIDFDDMIWCPLVEGSPVDQYDWVLVDEAQDTNVTRRMLAERMLKPGGRSVWVGDRHQAIYGFTGADSDALDLIAHKFEATLLPLSVTFRCCKAATRLAQDFVPHITAHEANEEGSVEAADVREMMGGGEAVRRGDAILCRLTAPLVELAYQLIRSGVPAHVEGRDIGKGLEALATKWASAKTAVDLTRKLGTYLKREREKLEARDEEYKVEALEDRVNTLHVIMEGCDTVAEVTGKIKTLFKDSNGEGFKGGKQHTVAAGSTVTLSTVHKAKGREWEKVWVLGWEEFMPSKWARQAWELQQEANLQYVAVTRAKMALVLVSLPPRS